MPLPEIFTPDFQRAVMSGDPRIGMLTEELMERAQLLLDARQQLTAMDEEPHEKARLELLMEFAKLRVIVMVYGVGAFNWSIDLSQQNVLMFDVADLWRDSVTKAAKLISQLQGAGLQITAWEELYKHSAAMMPFPPEAKPDIAALHEAWRRDGVGMMGHVIALERNFFPPHPFQIA